MLIFIFWIATVREYTKFAMTELVNDVEFAGVHAHGAGEGKGAGFFRSEFDNCFSGSWKDFFDI